MQLRWETLKTAADRPAAQRSTDEAAGGAQQQADSPSLRAQRRGTLVEFFDEFERASFKFPAHRELVAAAKRAAKQLKQNVWPGVLIADIDWSENGLIAAARQIQSEYWCLSYFSLLIMIVCHLKQDVWQDEASLLHELDEVTVEPEGSPPGALQPAQGSYYARVFRCPGGAAGVGADGIYAVKKEDGTIIEGIRRRHLRHRVFHTTAYAGVTDEKRHDGYTTTHFLNKMFEKFYRERFESGEFWAYLNHSDNASHFKSGQMLNYWAAKKKELNLKFLRVDYGCPGHGKGPWDGLGAVLKQRVARDILNHKVLTESGYITCPHEVAEHLSRRLDTPEWRAEHAKQTINDIKVMYSAHGDISERPIVEHDFESLTGKLTSFSYLMLEPEQIARRERSCFCLPCMHAHARNSAPMRLSADGELVCHGCESGNIFGGDAFPWHEMSMKKLGTGLAGRRKESQTEGKRLAMALHPGKFFAVQVSKRRRRRCSVCHARCTAADLSPILSDLIVFECESPLNP